VAALQIGADWGLLGNGKALLQHLALDRAGEIEALAD